MANAVPSGLLPVESAALGHVATTLGNGRDTLHDLLFTESLSSDQEEHVRKALTHINSARIELRAAIGGGR